MIQYKYTRLPCLPATSNQQPSCTLEETPYLQLAQTQGMTAQACQQRLTHQAIAHPHSQTSHQHADHKPACSAVVMCQSSLGQSKQTIVAACLFVLAWPGAPTKADRQLLQLVDSPAPLFPSTHKKHHAVPTHRKLTGSDDTQTNATDTTPTPPHLQENLSSTEVLPAAADAHTLSVAAHTPAPCHSTARRCLGLITGPERGRVTTHSAGVEG